MCLDIVINCLKSVILLLVLIDKILMSTPKLEILKEQKISRARKALERARNLRRSRSAMGVNGICQHINDVDGDWLEDWTDTEEVATNIEIHKNVSCV